MKDDGIIYGIERLEPYGTNSTMFTQCCGCAICDDQMYCPGCGSKVIGWNSESNNDRRRLRWSYATGHWSSK